MPGKELTGLAEAILGGGGASSRARCVAWACKA